MKLAMNRDDVNIALRRDLSNVMLSGLPQVCDLTCERVVDRERVGNPSSIGWAWAQPRWFLPQRRDQEVDPRVWCRPEAARQSTGPEVRGGELEHQGERCRSQGRQDRTQALTRRLRGLN